MNADTIRLMLSDVSRELLEKVRTAKAEVRRSGSEYDKGRHLALYEAVALLIDQAGAFGIDPKDIGLSDVDPERDLLAG